MANRIPFDAAAAPGVALNAARSLADAPTPSAERAKVAELSQQFEAMLMLQMVQQMRRSMLDESEEPQGLGGTTMQYQVQLDPNKLEIFHDSRTSADHDAFVSQMVRDYSFSTASARALNPATMSWVAVAFREADGTVAGVLYCDSKQPDFFTDARQEDILHATVGIAYFVGLRYS